MHGFSKLQKESYSKIDSIKLNSTHLSKTKITVHIIACYKTMSKVCSNITKVILFF